MYGSTATSLLLFLFAAFAHTHSTHPARTAEHPDLKRAYKIGSDYKAISIFPTFVMCTYAAGEECTYFPADGSSSFGSSDRPKGIAQDPSAIQCGGCDEACIRGWAALRRVRCGINEQDDGAAWRRSNPMAQIGALRWARTLPAVLVSPLSDACWPGWILGRVASRTAPPQYAVPDIDSGRGFFVARD
ncbi:hypothetical protein C8R44DRAFT_725517 [Mycena epipterygia]|nr:hypothetical protein C8R44DRAFT_725517 [Mycena epipterygia]